MESLRGLPEAVEADFGDAIVARDEAIAVLGTTPALGPPDLCWLQKAAKRTGLFGSSGESQGYYHYVLGRDVASSAAVAAYFALLNSKVEQRTMLHGLWGSAEVVIERGFYCCYDPISRMDVRCELCVPGGVAVGVVDAAGQLHETSPQMWQQAQVSAFVRAMLYDPEMRLNGGSVIAYDPCATAAAEASLLCSVLDLYSKGVLPGALQEIADEQGYGVAAEHMDLVLSALWQHFRRRQRWQAAADFFRELAQLYSPATLLLAAAERALSLSSAADDKGAAAVAGGSPATLSSLLVRPSKGPASGPHSAPQLVPATMVGLGLELLGQGEAEAAASLARRALGACPRCRPAWLLLARCFVAERQFAAALVALNVVPTPPLPAAEVELLHVVPPPAPKATTHPQVALYDGELEAARVVALEEASLDGSRLLAYLPGSILVNKEPLGAAYQLDICPNRITRSVLTAVYELLQAIVKEVGWDKFLEIRSRVFLMQHEVAQSPAAHASGSNAQQQQLHRLSSSEPAPSGAAAAAAVQASPSADLVALQAMQQAALLRKLEQLGLSADTPHSTGSPATEASVQATTSPPTTSAGAGARIGTPPTAPTSAGGASSGLQLHPGLGGASGSAGPTPPASRGRSSGGGAGSHRGGGSPQSYYASRLQEELAKPLPTPGSAGGSVGSPAAAAAAGALPYSQLTVRVPGERQQAPQQQQQQQQQQQTQQSAAPSTESAPQAASRPAPSTAPSATAAPAPRAPGTPGGGQRSMAGRVLLLGKTSAPRTSSSRRPASSRAAVPVGCGVPRSLAPNEVEDLSKYATASNVAPLRVPAAAGVNPELWNTVFGRANGSSSSSKAPGSAAAAAAASVRATEDDDDDGLSATAAGLPRIRTRPLGEAAEDGLQDSSWLPLGAGAPQAAAAGGAAGWHRVYCSSMPSFLHSQGSSTSSSSSSTSSSNQGIGRVRRLWSRVSAQPGHGHNQQGSCSSSTTCWQQLPQQQPQPLGEGLDRTTSLLNRTVSNASAGSTGLLPLSGPVRTGGSLGLHGSGSGQLGSARPRRVSLVGEAANRSLEADREGLTKGWVHDDTSAQAGWGGVDGVGSPGAGGRRLCVRWLDELIVALWHDLQAHMEWKVVDQALREARGGTAAELALGLVSGSPVPTANAAAEPSAAVPGVSDGGALEPPVLTCADWMRRGALAERLGHSLDARSAYRVAVKLAFNLTSYMALMRLEAEADSIASTALCVSQVLSWHQQRAGQHGATGGSSSSSAQATAGQGGGSGAVGAASGAGGDLVLMGVPPAAVVWALGMAVDGSSMQQVQRAISDVPPAAQAMLLAILEQWQKWKQVQVAPALAVRRR